ncbi:MAG: Riboflavin biosynthesis protein RibD [Gammaproteobacteria bacterium]|nr:MAG: Riboflavin biosynthesis protein RibD [Gammaproteobacteria bacterium]
MTVRDKLLKQKILKQPDVAILDSNLRIPLSHNIFSDENRNIYLFTNKKNTKKKYKSNVFIISNMADNDKIDIKKCIKYLASQEINNIFIESGPKLVESFLKLKLIDELLLYIAPIIIGHTGKNFSGVSYITKLSKKIKFTINDMISIGNDLKVRMVK